MANKPLKDKCCAARGCYARVPENHVMCNYDWSLVTIDTKHRLHRHAQGSQAHHEAVNDAIEEVSQYKAAKATGWRTEHAV